MRVTKNGMTIIALLEPTKLTVEGLIIMLIHVVLLVSKNMGIRYKNQFSFNKVYFIFNLHNNLLLLLFFQVNAITRHDNDNECWCSNKDASGCQKQGSNNYKIANCECYDRKKRSISFDIIEDIFESGNRQSQPSATGHKRTRILEKEHFATNTIGEWCKHYLSILKDLLSILDFNIINELTN